MFEASIYKKRREALKSQFKSGVILLLGNDDSPMNYRDNTYHFRQDSTFLYFFGLDKPGLTAILDLDSGSDTIFGNELTLEDIIWMGSLPSLADQAQKCGITQIRPTEEIPGVLQKANSQNRIVHFLPPYREANMLKLHRWLSIPLAELTVKSSTQLIRSIVDLRAKKTAEEIQEIDNALAVTKKMHEFAMRATQAGIKEHDLVGLVQGIASSQDRALAYPVILTVNGQTLHNHDHTHTLKSGQLVLGDYGAESPLHYASDITRTVPVDRTFTPSQKDVYEAVLAAQLASISYMKPGVSYLDTHLLSAKILVEGLKSMGLMKGDTDEAVSQGAHALFFPHGLGHMLGLDVHDMEDFGEDHIGYNTEFKRSSQFGLRYLRMARKLEEGFVLTVEPGIYFIPELIDSWKNEGKHLSFINYDKLEAFKTFGGIRIEDNVLVTSTGSRILGPAIAKTIPEIEAVRAT